MDFKKWDVSGSGKFVGGVDFSGSQQVPNETWLAVGNLSSLGVEIVEVRRIGSHSLFGTLSQLPELLALGLDFPFSLPLDFAQFLAESRSLPAFQSWQELAECLAFLSFEEFHLLVEKFGEKFSKESKRFTDRNTKPPAQSPMHRGNPSMIQMTYQGIRLLAGLDPAKFYIEPFQKASQHKCRVIEVYPGGALSALRIPHKGYKNKEKKNRDQVFAMRKQIARQLVGLREIDDIALKDIPRLTINAQFESNAITSDDCLDAIVACYTAAVLVTAPHYFSDPFESDNLDVLIEGCIYLPDKIWAGMPVVPL
jgi:hypothetical protein